ncbi:MAG: nSTAND1 domain-containing NTPase, partial [Anaerolineales bacterium]
MPEETAEQPAEPTPVSGVSATAGRDVSARDIAGRDIITTVTNIYGPQPALLSVGDELPAPGDSPYKGLEYFDEKDAENFFGREVLTTQLAARLHDERVLIIVGASGSGKSSVARAGLLPAMRREAGRVIAPVLIPGNAPMMALAASLLPLYDSSLTETDKLIESRKLATALRNGDLSIADVAERVRQATPNFTRLLLVVDQFEETFTLCKDEAERKAFIDCLMANSPSPDAGDGVATLRGGGWGLVLTLRADFYAFCEPYPTLRAALENRQAYIGPMTADELRRAIEAPAERGGWKPEDGLVESLLKDVGAIGNQSPEPGALPLLSHALLETWNNRSGRTLTLRGYARSGGVHGAIAKTADRAYASLTEPERTIARRIFLELTQLGEGTQDTRRRVALKDLFPKPEDEAVGRGVLKLLADPLSRLVVTEHDSVEVAHEALIREWQALRQWLDENRERLRVRRNLL